MTAGALERLLAVQDLDTLLVQLAHRREAMAGQLGLTAVESELAAMASEEASLTERRDALAGVQRDIEARVAVLEQRRAGIAQRMYAARGSSARDLQAMDEEVRHLGERRAELEEEELVAMVEQEPVDAALAALGARKAPLDERARELRAAVGAARAELEGELTTATARRAAEAAQLPAALADQYERLRTRLKGTGAARLLGHHCDGCHLELSSVEVERIRALPADTVATCEQCGRILVPV